MTNLLTRTVRAAMPRFLCELMTDLTCHEVEERIRGSLRTGFLRNRIKHPFTGTVGATEFKVGIDSWREDSPTYLRGQVQEVDGETSIRITAKLGISTLIESLAIGVIPCAAVVYFFAFEMPASVAIAFVGGSLVAVLVRKSNLQRFWEDLDDALVNLQHILDASVIWRTHDRYGTPIPEVQQRASQ